MPFCSLLLPILLLTLTFTCTLVQSCDEGYVTADISNKGLEFIKDALAQKAESSLVPLVLPEIENTVKVPILGSIQTALHNITVGKIHVTSSTLRTEDGEMFIDVSGATANLSMNWEYEYNTWLLPISVSDKGSATVQVEGLVVALILILRNQQGSLKLSTLACACHVHEISIELDGGASWLYQGFVDAFEGKIASAVEDVITEKLQEAIINLDSLLESIPKQVQVTSIASLNVTLVGDPKLSESSLYLVINGLFSGTDRYLLLRIINRSPLQPLHTCEEADKMVKISLHKDVLQSLSSVYFESNKMQWMVDKLPVVQSLLNTKEWRLIIPQLYKKYPNHDMTLNLTISSQPVIEVEHERIQTIFPLDMVVNVLDDEDQLTIPVFCISMEINTWVFAEITGNHLAGIVKLNDLSMSLKWSQVGNFHTGLIQKLVSTTLKTIVLPYLDLKLGLKLPTLKGYELRDARIVCDGSWIVMCSDVTSSLE